MSAQTTRFHVDVPPEAVFAYLEDPKATMPGMKRTEVIHRAPDWIGTSYRYEQSMFGLGVPGIYVITEHVPGKRFAIEFSDVLQEGTSTWTFEQAGDGTDATVESDFRLRIPVVGVLAMRALQRTNETRWVPALKRTIEAHARNASAA